VRLTFIAALSSTTVLLGGVALAQDAEQPAAENPDRMVLPPKRGLVQAFVGVNLSKDLVAEPISIAPDIWYGVSDVLTVGLVHSARGAVGFMSPVGAGLCVTGEDKQCADFYAGGGIDARYHVKDGPLAVAADGGVFVSDFDPFVLSLKVGAAVRWRSGKIAVDANPSIVFGLTEREGTMEGTVVLEGNKEVLYLPVTLLYGVIDKLAIAAQVGAVVPTVATADSWTLPVAVGAQFMATRDLFVDVAFGLPQVAGGPESTGFDVRTLTIGGGYAF
jgi:hypothetical protein